ncbi:MAG: single-stranded-DNA-specific exonuclease RecJ [Parcubacteria group bacterium CG1_02_37_51]|uniref:Single-stranded-DNA-specific exonuclease RecJ n=2 Tax=Candidatus Komeiliibacteriota TaxID=1817908 RepID=A0A2M8DRC4_9BACT|nr:MAG: single-stranded-DNA-specific exonuclease RecJ [Parcubacteria group bacterium CG1_02_37_51]PIY95331.1 MAG: single-stranded-DNA-specific exonuclease RecJ [Candidatus Komeilibacteria bacterium CG_4_10_14_0_8_um_filter_37_78]PJC01935.1 MAG: single-stranded-DNA-specific exonuclease RecJ [Candidatus Komeilibacteria bacterium CG_4_9_14_0_8_um_filter_36_9]
MKWVLREQLNKKQIDHFPEINPIVVQLLHNRGLDTQLEIDQFLTPDYSQDIHDPYLFNQMQAAVDRIFLAKKNKEKVCVFGDYDVDGVTGSAIISTFLAEQGFNYTCYIPHRDREGYGLNEQAVDKIAQTGASLIITVDCGISNGAEIKIAKDKHKIDTIIVDHHDLSKKQPPAVAIVHARLPHENFPYKTLSGGGTAFKLVQGLLRDKSLKYDQAMIESKEKWLLDLVALSTIGDMMPLLGENRTLVKYGLIVLGKTRRLGLQKLMEGAGVDLNQMNTQKVGWHINPRINAAGRLQHANLAYQLIMTDNIEQAIMMSSELNKSNQERQKLTEQYVKEADEQVQKQLAGKNQALIAYNDDWAPGVLGLVAGRLSSRYYRPVYALTKLDNKYVASGRSIAEYNITESLEDNKELFIKYGGHPVACGFSIEEDKLSLFIEQLTKYSQNRLAKMKLEPQIWIDSEIKLIDCNWDLFKFLKDFEPYGGSNEEPLFLIRDLAVTDWQTVGKDSKHLRLYVKQGEVIKKAIAFGLGEWAKDLKIDSRVDIICKIGVNEWNGNRELQITIEDLKLTPVAGQQASIAGKD